MERQAFVDGCVRTLRRSISPKWPQNMVAHSSDCGPGTFPLGHESRKRREIDPATLGSGLRSYSRFAFAWLTATITIQTASELTQNHAIVRGLRLRSSVLLELSRRAALLSAAIAIDRPCARNDRHTWRLAARSRSHALLRPGPSLSLHVVQQTNIGKAAP